MRVRPNRCLSQPASALVLLLLIHLVGCGRSAAPGSAAQAATKTAQELRHEKNRDAFRIARGASDPAVAPTFREARFVLSRIKPADVTDPDLHEYIGYMARVSDLCIAVGIPRSADPNPLKLLISVDPASVMQLLLKKGLSNVADEAKRLGGELASLRAGMGRLDELDRTLDARYRE